MTTLSHQTPATHPDSSIDPSVFFCQQPFTFLLLYLDHQCCESYDHSWTLHVYNRELKLYKEILAIIYLLLL